MNYWFAVDIDRCHISGRYGTGVRLYSDIIDSNTCFLIIDKYQIEGDNFYVFSKPDELCGNTDSIRIQLIGEPNTNIFKQSLWGHWKLWDTKYGQYQEDDRSDYEPIVYESKEKLMKILTKVD